MKADTTQTLAELATTWPAASRILHRHGLDFCCGGQQSLESACASRRLDAPSVLEEILSDGVPEPGPDWRERPLPELVRFVVDHYHARLRAELPELVALAGKVETAHAGRPAVPVGLAAHLRQMHASVLDHLEKEEQVLFPLILNGMGAGAAAPVRILEREHDDHAVSLRRMRELTDDLTAPDHACGSWRALCLRLGQLELELMQHIHLENNVLFPRALCE